MKSRFWTLRYALINITYFAAFCGIHAYASVFLLNHGFSNTMIGILLALANVISVVIQPIVAGIIDKGGKLTNRIAVMISTLTIIAGSLLLLFVGNSFIAVFIVYVLIYMIQMAYQPMMIAMNFEYQKEGCKINFGLARGLGSAGFAVTSVFLGTATQNYGVNVLIYTDVLVLLFSLLMVFFFKKPVEAFTNSTGEIVSKNSGEAHNNIFIFTKMYPKFMILMAGIVCLFFAHNALNDFLFQIVKDLGGNESQLGYANFLQAILELPMMAAAAFLIKKIGTKPLLFMSAVFFTVKVIILYLSTGIVGLYISESFQLLAYAVIIPVAAYYVTEVLEDGDQVKGQAFINCAITIGGVFSNLLCGKVLDEFGSKAMLLIGCIISCVGVLLFIPALMGRKSR